MSESVSLPALGESVTEGTVTRWLKKVGDRVEVDEPLLEVSTDKVDTEIPSPVAGVIEQILVQEDETVEVGTALVTIGDGSGSDEQAPAPAAAEAAPTAQEAAPEGAAPSDSPAPAPAFDAQQPAPPAAPTSGQFAPPQPEAPQAEAPVVPAPVPTPAETGVPSTEQPVEAEQPAASGQDAPEQAPAEQPTPAEQSAPAEEPAPPAEQPEQPAQVPPVAEAAQPAASEPRAEAPAEATPASAEPAAAAPEGPRAGYVTPIVRKLAHEKGIDLETVTGTGVGGRIRKQDVLDASAASAAESAAPAAEAPAAAEVSPLRGTTVPMTRLRKVVAERAVVSMQTLAQLTTVVEVDVTRVAALRDRVKADFQAKTGVKLSFLPFFTLAAAEALRAFPIINATVDGDNIVYPDHEHISIAVDTERGLLTPVIRDAGELDIAGIAQQIADLAARTRDNKLKPDELAGGTFTVTNTGSRGALFDTPIVFLPQSAILGTGIVTKKPVVVSESGSDAIAIRSTVYLALSYDHRIVDGADAARFLGAVKSRLEKADFEAQLGI
jgi:2-oxoglutarate dehydrogenase E2 component (dihydrolipoamide succinyltransferase)